MKIGALRGEVVYELLSHSRELLHKSLQELEDPVLMPGELCIRHPGGGPKGVLYKHEDLEANLGAILDHTIAGDPLKALVK